MPPKTSSGPAEKRGRPPQKQPGVSASASSAGVKRKRQASRPAKAAAGSASHVQDTNDAEMLATLKAVEATERVAIPAELVRRILHQVLKDKGVRMTQEASVGFAKYLDLFLREGIRRASDEKPGTFLEVEALETAAPQLLLDF